MTRKEILCTVYGEMVDMIACDSVYNGNAEQQPKHGGMAFADILDLE